MVVREAESRAVLDVLNQLVTGMDLAFSLVQIPDSDDWGTADSLRHLRGKLKVLATTVCDESFGLTLPFQPQHSDVLVVSCDLVTSIPVQLLTDFHSCHHSTFTCLLSRSPPQQEDTHRKTAASAGELMCHWSDGTARIGCVCRVRHHWSNVGTATGLLCSPSRFR